MLQLRPSFATTIILEIRVRRYLRSDSRMPPSPVDVFIAVSALHLASLVWPAAPPHRCGPIWPLPPVISQISVAPADSVHPHRYSAPCYPIFVPDQVGLACLSLVQAWTTSPQTGGLSVHLDLSIDQKCTTMASSSSGYVSIPCCPVIFFGTNYAEFAAFMRIHMCGL
jgi:hypothetical protein